MTNSNIDKEPIQDNNIRSLNPSMFNVKSVNKWLEIGSSLPISKPLFGSIWHEYEVAILFANTGKGKSILSYQLFDAISKGNMIFGLETTQSRVLYFDFELSPRSLYNRYTDNTNQAFVFNENFIRAEINHEQIDIEDIEIEQEIFNHIEKEVKKYSPKAICIDNSSFLSSNNEKSKDALSFLKKLLKLSRKEEIAILVLAHRPKQNGLSMPVTLDHLAGSKALSNFCDVCYTIGDSVKDSNIVYIKELKNRNRAIVYNSTNVIECTITKDQSLLKFELIDFTSEKEHLYQPDDTSDNQLQQISQLKDEGLNNVQIAKRLGISEGTVRNKLKKAK